MGEAEIGRSSDTAHVMVLLQAMRRLRIEVNDATKFQWLGAGGATISAATVSEPGPVLEQTNAKHLGCSYHAACS